MSLFQSLHFIPDRAVSWLIKFLYYLLKYCGRFSPRITQISEALPRSLYLRDKYIGDSKSVCRYVVCPACHSLYSYDQCVQKTGTQTSSKTCSSQNCKCKLLKEVVSISGNVKLYPSKVYCYNSVIASLNRILLRPGIIDACESTRKDTEQTVLQDIYQGSIWKEFLKYNGKEFLVSSLSYALILNVDWFQPFERFTYSVGVIYLVLLNLPRSIRYKRENVILVGVIPGPSEPSLNINSYLSPLVSELLELWTGVPLSESQVMRAVLLAVSCDLPAGRKVCGLLGHSANLGCSRCYCSFSEGFGRQNYSNFDRSSWLLRSNQKHRDDIKKIQKCKTKTERVSAESALGCRYSILLQLPYFDPIRMLLIDPMHNLFLGTAKYVTQKIWIGNKVLKTPQLNIIHNRLQKVQVPGYLGRLPSNISSGATFTAEQWMNWTIYFSIYCLHGLLPCDTIESWRHFVLACRRLCKRSISSEDVQIVDALLLQFCTTLKRLYGAQFVTPNMHLHCHLATCLKDFGPLHGYWLFSFERYNGLLGNQPTNNRAIEIQLMNRFLKDNSHFELLHIADSMPLHEEFGPLVSEYARTFDSTAHTKQSSTETSSPQSLFCEPSKYKLGVLCQDSITVLKQLYSNLYPQYMSLIAEDKLTIPSSIRKYQYIQMNGKKLSSVSEGSQARVPYVLAKPVFQFSPNNVSDNVRPVQIQYFVKHSFYIPSTSNPPHPDIHNSCVFAFVQWPQIHPQKDVMGKPVEIWCNNLFEPTMLNTFLPIDNIVSRVAIATHELDNEDVLVIIPLLH